jgi:hypothetical protein
VSDHEARDKERRGLSSLALKVYLFSAGIVMVVSFLGSLMSSSLPSVTLETSTVVLENVIRLDGILFGFTAAMLSIFYLKGQPLQRSFLSVIVFIVTAFLSFLLSIFMSFSYLMQGLHTNAIFLPVILTCFGGLASSVYVILVILSREPSER